MSTVSSFYKYTFVAKTRNCANPQSKQTIPLRPEMSGNCTLSGRSREPRCIGTGYSLKTTGGPATRFPLRSVVTSTRSAILIKGMPLFIP
jgi:hypothetical protein